jgi:hypothetical protein
MNGYDVPLEEVEKAADLGSAIRALLEVENDYSRAGGTLRYLYHLELVRSAAEVRRLLSGTQDG